MEFAALIANWNGEPFIERCLDSVFAAARNSPREISAHVVDDASSDGSVDLISRRFGAAELIALDRNVGFGAAVTSAMRRLKAPWVFLLNNDLVLEADFFDRLADARDSAGADQTFAIGARTVRWGRPAQANHAGMRARWLGGMIVQEGFASEQLAPSDFIQAGACLVDRKKFLALGGFCDLYAPAYWEDYDLAYQALRRGWANYYEPRAIAHHWGKRSMKARYTTSELARLDRRNHLLFNWVNLSDRRMLARHLMGLGALALRTERGTEALESAGWMMPLAAALRRLPRALSERRRRPSATPISDRAILLGE